MSHQPDINNGSQFKGVMGWIDQRLPIFSFVHKELKGYPTPWNLNYLWNFGSLAGITLVIMILTGLFLAMHYTPQVDLAFSSVERIMREVNYGWLIRYIHMNGASMFFIVVYIHIFRGLFYGSYKAPRELLWMLGVLILLLMMATAFMGYVLPWGQMSYWGATVITNLFSTIPGVGESIVTWLWGGFSVDNPTLNRFFALHYLLPFLIVAVVGLHLVALHMFGSNNPLGIERTKPEESVPFHPYYTVKDLFGLGIFLLIWGFFVFFAPNFFGEPDNYIPANPLVTPPHIVPEWYFLPFYAILRSVPSKLGGVILMFGAIFVLFVLPWLDTHPVRSGRFRPFFKIFYGILLIICLTLGWVGSQLPEGWPLWIGRISTFYYFFHFLVILPLLSRYERALPLPNSLLPDPSSQKSSRKKTMCILMGLVIYGGLGGGLQSAVGAEEEVTPPTHSWSFQSPLGTFKRDELQRGFQVYSQVCAACHGLYHLRYEHLKALGYKPAQLKAIAAQHEVTGPLDDEGNPTKRPAKPGDLFFRPFANEKAARAANNGAYPPDQSLIVKARKHGPEYVRALLLGYQKAPSDMKLASGMYYNRYFPGHQIAMAPPLTKGLVQYADGTPATPEQMAHDVVAFLAWASEPTAEARKRMGVKVLAFLSIFTLMMYAVMRKTWRPVKEQFHQ